MIAADKIAAARKALMREEMRHAAEGYALWLLDVAEAAAQLEPRVAVLMDRVYAPDVWLPDDLTETYEELGPRRHEEGGKLDEGSWMVKRINASLPRLHDALEAQP